MHITTFFTFFNVLLNKSNCFRTVELHVVEVIVMLFYLTALTDLILYYFNLLYYWSNWTEYFFLSHILSSFTRSQAKTLTVKFRLIPRKTLISGILLTFFYWLTMFPIQIAQYCECDYSVKIWRIDLMKACHVIPILFSFMLFSGDHKCH